MRYCKHCESPLDDERDELDENGKAYCECDGAEIERLKETLNDTIDLLNIREKQVNDLLDENKNANEDADELYKWLSHVVDTYDSNGWTVPESWRTALKEHEERIWYEQRRNMQSE